MPSLILIRGGGDLASGVALRLYRAGLKVVITEIPQPLAIRRTVSFAESIYSGEVTFEGLTARSVPDPTDNLRILSILGKQQIPVLVDPYCYSAKSLFPAVIVDGRMTKCTPEPIGYSPALYIGLGPGFVAGENCQAVIETRRGPTMGRVYWHGGPAPDSSAPEGDPQRVLRSPVDGVLEARSTIGDHVEIGQVIAEIKLTIDENHNFEIENRKWQLVSPLRGILRGLIHPGLTVTRGQKIGDVDPRDDPTICHMVSDKALAVGGGVLEVILTRPEVRKVLWV